ncbi:MAG: DUF167 domain-containing protein [Candidatus Magasanikbacteria bacterium]
MKKLKVKVNPNSSQVAVNNMADGTLKVNLTAQPKDGKANEQLLKILAEKFGVDTSGIKIKRGKTSRRKTVLIKT